MLDIPTCFNPLDRGNLYQIEQYGTNGKQNYVSIPQIGEICIRLAYILVCQRLSKRCFNPLDRGNLYLMLKMQIEPQNTLENVSIPQIGEICIRYYSQRVFKAELHEAVLIPQIGGICIRLDSIESKAEAEAEAAVSIPQIGEICI